MKQRWLIGMGFTAVAILLLAWLFWPHSQRIAPDAYKQIEAGMNQAQIEVILGVPPGDYYTGPRGRGMGMFSERILVPMEHKGMASRDIPKSWREDGRGPKTGYVESWWGEDYLIEVAFDENGGAVGWHLHYVGHPESTTIIDRIREILGVFR
jgi:hypothetical protein